MRPLGLKLHAGRPKRQQVLVRASAHNHSPVLGFWWYGLSPDHCSSLAGICRLGCSEMGGDGAMSCCCCAGACCAGLLVQSALDEKLSQGLPLPGLCGQPPPHDCCWLCCWCCVLGCLPLPLLPLLLAVSGGWSQLLPVLLLRGRLGPSRACVPVIYAWCWAARLACCDCCSSVTSNQLLLLVLLCCAQCCGACCACWLGDRRSVHAWKLGLTWLACCRPAMVLLETVWCCAAGCCAVAVVRAVAPI